MRFETLVIEELQHRFDTKLLESAKERMTYARNLLEFYSYHQLSISLEGTRAPQARFRGDIFNLKKSSLAIAIVEIFNGTRVLGI